VKLNEETIVKMGGKTLLSLYEGSLVLALTAIYPMLPIWTIARVPAHYWDDTANQLKYFDWLAKQLSIEVNKSTEFRVIQSLGLYTMVQHQSITSLGEGWRDYPSDVWKLAHACTCSSLSKLWLAILEVQTHFTQVWIFSEISVHHFHRLQQSVEHQRKLFDHIAESMNWKKLDEWYNARISTLKEPAPSIIKNFYNNSLLKALETIYPEYNWLPWRFSVVPEGMLVLGWLVGWLSIRLGLWKDKEIQLKFFEWYKKEKNITDVEDWYRVKTIDIVEKGGRGLLAIYGLLSTALREVYPEIPWEMWKFNESSSNFLQKFIHSKWVKGNWTIEYQRQYMDTIGARLGVKELEDWYSITKSQVVEQGGLKVLRLYEG
jgi:hypothetical protein